MAYYMCFKTWFNFQREQYEYVPPVQHEDSPLTHCTSSNRHPITTHFPSHWGRRLSRSVNTQSRIAGWLSIHQLY